MSQQRKYDSTVARIAGNIASGLVSSQSYRAGYMNNTGVAVEAVAIARAIVAETERTEIVKEPSGAAG